MDQIRNPTHEIVITAARAPEQAAESAGQRHRHRSARSIERLGEPLVPALLRLTPSAAVATLRAGRLADRSPHPRRRGQSHPAVHRRHPRQRPRSRQRAALRAAQRRPRLADRGGSRPAIGTVGLRGHRRRDRDRWRPTAKRDALAFGSEAGSLRFPARVAIGFACQAKTKLAAGVSAGSGQTASTSSTARRQATAIAISRAEFAGELEVAPTVELGASGFVLIGPDRVRRQRSRHLSRRYARPAARDRLAAGRLWAAFGHVHSPWSGKLSARCSRSRNRNFFTASEINRTSRGALDARRPGPEARSRPAAIEHRLILALEHESEEFKARERFWRSDRAGPGPQAQSLTFEWRADAGPRDQPILPSAATASTASRTPRRCGHRPWPTSVAAFRSPLPTARALPSRRSSICTASFPEVSSGNPSLKPESSRGFEASIRYRKDSHWRVPFRLPPAAPRRDRRRVRLPRPSCPARRTARSRAAAPASRRKSAGDSATNCG